MADLSNADVNHTIAVASTTLSFGRLKNNPLKIKHLTLILIFKLLVLKRVDIRHCACTLKETCAVVPST